MWAGSSMPSWQWGQMRWSLGCARQRPVSSAPQWDPVRNCASASRWCRCRTSSRYAAPDLNPNKGKKAKSGTGIDLEDSDLDE